MSWMKQNFTVLHKEASLQPSDAISWCTSVEKRWKVFLGAYVALSTTLQAFCTKHTVTSGLQVTTWTMQHYFLKYNYYYYYDYRISS